MTESEPSNGVMNLKWRWSSFESTRSDSFREMRRSNEFFDVTLCADNGMDTVNAHKVILAAGSNLFRRILTGNTSKNTLLYLKGVHLAELESLVNFIYHGEVRMEQEALDKFLKVADEFEVKGLASLDRSEATTTATIGGSRNSSKSNRGNNITSANTNANITSASNSNNGSVTNCNDTSNARITNNSHSWSYNVNNSICSTSTNSSNTDLNNTSLKSTNNTKSISTNLSNNNYRPTPLKQLLGSEKLTPEKISTITKRRKVDVDFDMDADVDDMLNAYVRKVKDDTDVDNSYKEIVNTDKGKEEMELGLGKIKVGEEGSNLVDPPVEELQEKAKFSKTQRGNPMLIDGEGYTYLMARKNSDRLYWTCRFARTVNNDNCKASAVTKGLFIAKKFNYHNHEPRFRRTKESYW